jgi:valyl-tRNA synthetase
VQEVVRAIRNFWAEHNILPPGRTQAVIAAGQKVDLLRTQAPAIAALIGLDASKLQIERTLRKKPALSLALMAGPVEIHLPLEGTVDLKAERKRLSKEVAATEVQIKRLEQLLAGEFATKAPAPVIARERERLATLKETAEKLKAQFKG